MKLTTKQKRTINELIKYIKIEQANPVVDFNMDDFGKHISNDSVYNLDPDNITHSCNTSCCLLGLHAINSNTKIENWDEYSESIGISETEDEYLWNALFHWYWPNSLEAAKQRCIWVLENEDTEWRILYQDLNFNITIH